MEESGISLSFDDQILMDPDLDDQDLLAQLTPSDLTDFDFYELRSKTVPVAESPSFKTEMASTRTQIRQQLQREKILQEEQRKHEKLTSAPQVVAPNTSKVVVEPVRVPIIPAVELPHHVLKVTTKLQNPTKYHMLAKRTNQVLQFLSTSQQDDPVEECFRGRLESAQSAPVIQVLPPKLEHTSMSYNNPFSPEVASVATSVDTSDAGEVIEDILSYEASSLASDTQDDSLLTQSMFGLNGVAISTPKNKTHSCPSGFQFKQEPQDDPKDRMKKENHNIIERRRRCNINDRIKEIGDLLPKSNDRHYDIMRDNKSNKGTILKSAVDYIKILKNDVSSLKIKEAENRRLVNEKRALLLCIQELEIQAKANGLPVRKPAWTPANADTIQHLISSEPKPKNVIYQQIPDFVSEVTCIDNNMEEIMEEEDGVLHKDAMLYSPLSHKSGSSAGSHYNFEDVEMNASS